MAACLHTYVVVVEWTTRANQERAGYIRIKAASPHQAIARAQNRVGKSYRIPEAAVDVSYLKQIR